MRSICTTTILAAALPLALLASCNKPAAEAAASDPKAALEAIHKTEAGQMEAFGKKDIGGATGLYAADATMIAPGEKPVNGSQAITGRFTALINDPGFTVTPDEKSAYGWVAASGDLAVTGWTGETSMTGTDGKVAKKPMANQTVWKKQDDGSWKIQSDVNAYLPE